MSEWTAVSLLAVVSAIFLCGFWLAPKGVLALRRLAGGAMPVDLRLTYSPETLFSLLEQYGPPGRRAYRAMLYADMVFATVYGTTLYLCGHALGAAHPDIGVLSLVARCAAVTAAVFDYGENVFLLRVLRRRESRPVISARLAAICTASKMTALAVVLGAFAVMWRNAAG